MNGEWMAMNYHAAILPHLRVLPMCRVAKKLKAIAEPYSDCRLADNFGNRYANARFQKPPQKSSELGNHRNQPGATEPKTKQQDIMNSNNQSSPKSFLSPMTIGLIGSAVLLVAAIGSALYNRTPETPKASINQVKPGQQPQITQQAPPQPPAEMAPAVLQANFKTLDGRTKKLADYSGKVVVVDLWATWCGPCRQEIPHLIAMAKDYKSKGVEVIGLTNENPVADEQKVKDFSKEFKINYPLGWADPQMQIGLMNGRNGIPQTIIIGRDGKVKKHFVGFSAMISPQQMKAALDEAIAAG
jgi:thiol-disulfide isomerase/thioredoxin